MTARTELAGHWIAKPPPMGGFSLAIVRLEVRRLLRNRQTLIFTMVLAGDLLSHLRPE